VNRSRGSRALCAALLLLLTACATGPLTLEEEGELGRAAEQQARRKFRFVRDEVVVGYVAGIGEDLLRAMGPQPFDYDFYVIEDEELNAFAMPGGIVYVHTGLILKARNVSELVGVMGHEIGHVYHRHLAENFRRQRNTGLAQQLGVFLTGIFYGGYAAQAADLVSTVSAVAYLNSFSRDDEREADAFAADVLPKAGYDPSGLVTFFATMMRQYGDRAGGFLSSHPATQERIDNANAVIAAQQLPPHLRQDDDGKLEIVQHRIRLLMGEAPPRR
jgi:beta-barrel assembly-enhancing protease